MDEIPGVAQLGWRHDERNPAVRQRHSRRPGSQSAARPGRPGCPSLVQQAGRLTASWRLDEATFEIDLALRPSGLSVRLRTWIDSRTALEESFLLHTLDDLNRWLVVAPTKFGHPVAHQEIQRFAHAFLMPCR